VSLAGLGPSSEGKRLITSDIAVFGIGPAGMVAGWAALRAGHRVTYFSNTSQKSTLYGCQYLHAPIPLKGYKIRHAWVEYRLQGTAEGYRHKVYGDTWEGAVSPEDLCGEHEAWDIRQTYDALWDVITQHPRVKIVSAEIDHNWLRMHTRTMSAFAHVISTIPATALCENPTLLRSQSGHFFASHAVKAIGSVAEEPEVCENEVVCDGTPEALWYRSATVFGYSTVEWPRTARLPEVVRAAQIRKPLYTECYCHPEIVRLGRYGAWRKGVLVHHVFEDAEKVMQDSWVNES
jgi:hypothetical protein